MPTIENSIQLEITQEDVYNAIQQAKDNNFTDNLRHRHVNVSFDSKVRGYIGEIALRNWFSSNGIQFAEANAMPDGADLDIDLLYTSGDIALNLEIKTSLIPPNWGTLERCLRSGDIKLIRRGYSDIEDLQGDLHLQIYFSENRAVRDTFLKQQTISLNSSNEDIYNALDCNIYLNNTHFVGWIDKETLILNINNARVKTWSFPNSQKDFWKCSLATRSRNPSEIIYYINNLNS